MSFSTKGLRCRHPDCKYRAQDMDGYKPWGCNYSDITGVTKHKAAGHSCPPEKCPFYERGTRVRTRMDPLSDKPRAMDNSSITRGPHYDWEGEARRLWLEGKSDAEVAKIMGCGVTYAGEMRRKLGLQRNQLRLAEAKRPKDPILQKLYDAGLNDEQIARGYNIYAGIIADWRKGKKLPPNRAKIRNQDKAREIFDKITKEETSHG